MTLVIELEDKNLVKEAQSMGHHKDETETVIAALQEYVDHHRQKKTPATALQQWVDELYGQQRPDHVVETLIAERRQEATQE